jgi:hypothetical protein
MIPPRKSNKPFSPPSDPVALVPALTGMFVVRVMSLSFSDLPAEPFEAIRFFAGFSALGLPFPSWR